MTTPVSVRYQLGYLCQEIDQLLHEDEEVFESKGRDSLISAKNSLIDAIKSMTEANNKWKGKE